MITAGKLSPPGVVIAKYNVAIQVTINQVTTRAIQNVLRLPCAGLWLVTAETITHARAGPKTATPIRIWLTISWGSNKVGMESIHIMAYAKTKKAAS